MSAALLLLAMLTPTGYSTPWGDDDPELRPQRTRPYPDSGPRLLLDIGAIGGGGIENVVPRSRFAGTVSAAGLGLYFSMGLQIDDHWGGGPELSGGTSVFWSFGRGALVVDYTPADWITIAFGPVAWIDGMSLRGCPKYGCTASSAQALGGTLRVDFHLAASRTADGRSARTLGIVTDVGTTAAEGSYDSFRPGIAWGVYLSFRYTSY